MAFLFVHGALTYAIFIAFFRNKNDSDLQKDGMAEIFKRPIATANGIFDYQTLIKDLYFDFGFHFQVEQQAQCPTQSYPRLSKVVDSKFSKFRKFLLQIPIFLPNSENFSPKFSKIHFKFPKFLQNFQNFFQNFQNFLLI